MKTKLVLFTIVCLLLGLTTSVSAQNNVLTAEQADIMNAAIRQMDRDSRRQDRMSSLLSGNEMSLGVLGLFHQNDFREELGVSPEQWQRIGEGLRNVDEVIENNPNYQSLQNEEDALRMSFREAVMSNATPNVLEEIQKNRLDLRAKMWNLQSEKRASIFEENLSPNQMRRIQEYYISTMSERSIVFPRMFEALDLSGDQRKQFDEIQKEMMPEFEKHVEKMVEYDVTLHEIINDGLMAELRTLPDDEARRRFTSDRRIRILAEMQPEMYEILESGREVADALKIKMFDVLTDEQWARMIDLVDNPPDYVVALLKKWREERAANAPAGGWVPGPGSWHPGDPIPGAYRIERETRSRFPRGEN